MAIHLRLFAALFGATLLIAETPQGVTGPELQRSVEKIVALGQVGQLCSLELARLNPELQRLEDGLASNSTQLDVLEKAYENSSKPAERSKLKKNAAALLERGKDMEKKIPTIRKDIAETPPVSRARRRT